MKKSDIVSMRHPSSAEPELDLVENHSYAVIVSLDDAAENLRHAKERFIKMQMEQFRLL